MHFLLAAKLLRPHNLETCHHVQLVVSVVEVRTVLLEYMILELLLSLARMQDSWHLLG